MKTDWAAGLFFMATAVILESITAWSSADVFPQMKGKIFFAWLAIVTLAGLVKHMADEPDDDIRQKGLICLLIINSVLTINTMMHFDYGRELSAGLQNVDEKNVQEDKDLARDKERAAIAQQIAGANAQQMKAGRDLMVHVPRSQVGGIVSTIKNAVITAPTMQAQPTPQPGSTPLPAVKTPAQIRAEYATPLFWAMAIAFAVSVIGTTILYVIKNWDGDGDGVPDRLQKIAGRIGESAFKELYPQYYLKYHFNLFPKAVTEQGKA